MTTERLFNSPTEGEVFLIEEDGEIVDARRKDGDGKELDIGKLKSEFKPADPAEVEDPVGTAPPLTPDADPDLKHGSTTALAGHEVEGFPNEEIPEKGMNPAEANALAEEKGVPEAIEDDLVGTQSADEKPASKKSKKG